MYKIIKFIDANKYNPIGAKLAEEINNQLRFIYNINRYVLLLGTFENPREQALTLQFSYGKGIFNVKISEYNPIDIDNIISIIEPETKKGYKSNE